MATKRPLLIVALLGAAVLCACTSVRWHKADGDDAKLAQDLAACRQLAQSRSGAIGAPGMANVDPRFGAPSGPSQADVRMQEGQAEGKCMRGKGYVLVEDKK